MNPLRFWQLTSLVLAGILIAAAFAPARPRPAPHPSTVMLPAANKFDDSPTLALSPAARRAHMRYSL
jgi:hypothetical protein